MSSSNESESWVDRWWILLVLLFGAILATILAATAARVHW